MHTYKLDTINYKDGEFHVRFVPNSEPIEFVVSGKSAEKFFDALKAIDYKTDEEPSIVRRIQMGNYNGKSLYWIYLGHYDDETDLFLSEDIICNRRFDSKSNDWHNSELAKWLSVEFTEEAFLPSEYRQLVPLECTDNGKFGYKLFLLSRDEYKKYRNEIPNVDGWWWLRSPMLCVESRAACVNSYLSTQHANYSDNVRMSILGVRPAMRLRRS